MLLSSGNTSYQVTSATVPRAGTYEIDGSLLIRHSGVILRGSGMGPDGTILRAAGHDRRTLIRITGIDDRTTNKPIDIAESPTRHNHFISP